MELVLLGRWLRWNGFHVKEALVTDRAPHFTDSFVLLLVIQVLVALTCGIQIQGCAWEQGQCVFNSRSPTVCSTQSDFSGGNRTDSSTSARLSVWALTSHAVIPVSKWLMVGADNQVKNSFKCSSSSAGLPHTTKIGIMVGKSFHISSITLSAEIQQWWKLCLDWFRQIMLKGLRLQAVFI